MKMNRILWERSNIAKEKNSQEAQRIKKRTLTKIPMSKYKQSIANSFLRFYKYGYIFLYNPVSFFF